MIIICLLYENKLNVMTWLKWFVDYNQLPWQWSLGLCNNKNINYVQFYILVRKSIKIMTNQSVGKESKCPCKCGLSTPPLCLGVKQTKLTWGLTYTKYIYVIMYMYRYVCMYMYIYVCMYVCMYVCLYICIVCSYVHVCMLRHQ